MLIFVGDIHGIFNTILRRLHTHATKDDIIIQVGDLGVWPRTMPYWNQAQSRSPLPCPFYFIDGNHEHFPTVSAWDQTKVTEVAEGLHFIPRGLVLTLQGKRIGFLGGGESLNMADKKQAHQWYPDERVTDEQVDRLIENAGTEQLDILVSHCPPSSVIASHWPPVDKYVWGLPKDWEDVSSQRVERAYRTLNPKQMICGHMHKSYLYDNVRLLDIEEMMSL